MPIIVNNLQLQNKDYYSIFATLIVNNLQNEEKGSK